jgi:hypothetical protein
MTGFVNQDETFAWTGFPKFSYVHLRSLEGKRPLQPAGQLVRHDVKNIERRNHEWRLRLTRACGIRTIALVGQPVCLVRTWISFLYLGSISLLNR